MRVDHEILATARLHVARPATQPTVLRLNLFDDVVLRAAIDGTGPTSAGYSLSGRIEGEPLSSVTLVVNGEVIAGTVRTLARTVTVTTVGDDGVLAIREIDPASRRFREVVDDPGPSASREPQSPRAVREPASGTQPPPEGVAAAGATVAAEVRGGSEDGSRIDVLVVYTPMAREQAGGVGAIQVLIDLRVAETNQAFANSGVTARIHLAHTAEVAYTEVPRALDPAGRNTIDHLRDPSDGYMDEVHVLRDRYAADLVHLIVDNRFNTGGEAKRLRDLSSLEDAAARNAFSITKAQPGSGSVIFAHELGHSMGLAHDRYAEIHVCCSGLNRVYPYSHGYVNQRAFEPDAPRESYWRTIMSYPSQCDVEARLHNMCVPVLRFSNPDLTHSVSANLPGDPLGVPGDEPSIEITGPADARRSLNETSRFVANFRVAPANLPPVPVGMLAPLAVELGGGPVTVEVSEAFRDPDGDALTYGVSSSAPSVAQVGVSESRVTVTPVSEGKALVTVTATDTGGSNTPVTRRFTVTVLRPFSDHPIVPGVTPVRAVHFTELRMRIDALRSSAGLEPFAWTDPILRAGATSVRLVHLLDLRTALGTVYSEVGRPAPRWTDGTPMGGTTPIRAAHLMELRKAVVAFPHGGGVPKSDVIAVVPDRRDPELAGHLDLIEVALYEDGGDAVIVEFTTRDPIPEPGAGTRFSYRLAFDVDSPYWVPDYSVSRADADFDVRMVLRPDGEHYARGGRLLAREGNYIALLADIPEDSLPGTPASVIAEVACFDNPSCGRADFSRPELIELPTRSEGLP